METQIQPLSLDVIRVDDTLHPRVRLNDEALADYQRIYKEAKKDGDKHPFPPLRVFRDEDGDFYWLSRGFHRYNAAKVAGWASHACEILQGDSWDAYLDARKDEEAETSGVRRTAADRREIVEGFLNHEMSKDWTQQQIAEASLCSTRTVKRIMAAIRADSINAPSSSGGKGTVSQSTRHRGEPGRPRGGGKKGSAKEQGNEFLKLHEDSKPPEKKLTDKERQVSDARAQINIWAETVGRFLSQEPSIDDYRNQFPGTCTKDAVSRGNAVKQAREAIREKLEHCPQGDQVLALVTELYEALKNWQRTIKVSLSAEETTSKATEMVEEAAAEEPEEEPTIEEIVDEHNRVIESFCRALNKQAKAKPDLEWLDHKGRWGGYLRKIGQGLDTLRSAKAVVCPACEGATCKECDGHGYLPKVEAESVRGFGRSDGHTSPRDTQAHKPPKQLDRSAWFRQWDQAMGPLKRLTDKVANGVNEKHCKSHKDVHRHLNAAADAMREWMGVEW